MTIDDIRAELFERFDLRLSDSGKVGCIEIYHEARDKFNELHGPFLDISEPDLRFFVSWTQDGKRNTVDIITQDATDNAFLNSGVNSRVPSGAIWITDSNGERVK